MLARGLLALALAAVAVGGAALKKSDKPSFLFLLGDDVSAAGRPGCAARPPCCGRSVLCVRRKGEARGRTSAGKEERREREKEKENSRSETRKASEKRKEKSPHTHTHTHTRTHKHTQAHTSTQKHTSTHKHVASCSRCAPVAYAAVADVDFRHTAHSRLCPPPAHARSSRPDRSDGPTLATTTALRTRPTWTSWRAQRDRCR